MEALELLTAGLGGAVLGGFALVGILFYVYFAFAIMTIAKKTNTDNAWLAWIPIANLYLLITIAGKPWWWLLVVLFVPLVPIIGALASVAIIIWFLWLISEKRGFPGWVALLMLVPLVGLAIPGVLAWGKP